MPTIKKRFALLVFAGIGIFSSCKKGDEIVASTPPAATPPPVVTPVSAAALKDSALLISRNLYLWDNQIPSSFNAQNYADPAKVLEAIRPYSIEPGFSTPVDRWSFAMKKTEWDEISGKVGSNFSGANGATGDFGITVFFRVEGDLRVRHAEPNSPAGLAGIRRGWKITQINGNSNIVTSNADFIVNNIYNATTSTITFQRPDGSQTTLTLNAGKYAEKPVYLDTVYTVNNTKIGYLVFNSFLGNQTQIQSEFARVFNKFSSEGVTEMIVDLRYNGGGYVDLQTKLANYLVKSSANGQLMMKQVFNSKNTQNNETTSFQKVGGLNLDDIYFIVGRSTASASELLINNLRPYMDVKLVGGATHGKPVGYFPVSVGEWYVFPVSFRTTNKNNEGNYFNGFAVNAQVADGLDKDWGDTNETTLASVIRNITTGSYLREVPYHEPTSVAFGNNKLDEALLKITVDTR